MLAFVTAQCKASKTETDELLTIQATPRAGTLERDGVVERQVAPVGERV